MLQGDDFLLLLFLAKKGALERQFGSSTSEIASVLGASQQTASRKLRGLEQMQMISRVSSPTGTKISISEKGKAELKNKFFELRDIFEKRQQKKLQGIVAKGLGEGSFYLSQQKYLGQLREIFGSDIFIGTLNLRVNEKQLEEFLEGADYFSISGFSTSERSFGAIKGVRVMVNNSVGGALIFPERSNAPKNIVELIAPISLRKKFSLKDGDKLTIYSVD